jgi:hypothetical protein
MAEPAFDHHAYPQLIDAILAYSPPQSLLAFRGTDRHYRARVDDMLFEHVIVRPASTTAGKGKGRDDAPGLAGLELLCACSPYTRLPLLPYDPQDELDRWVLCGSPGARPSTSPVSEIREDCREDLAARIHVVDLYGRPEVPFPFNRSFMDLEILRRPAGWSAHDQIAAAPVVVDFIDLAQCAPGLECDLHIDPGEARRHIMHLAFPSTGHIAYRTLTYTQPNQLRDLVFVFSKSSASSTQPPNAQTSKTMNIQDAAERLVEIAESTVVAGGSVTCVSVDSLAMEEVQKYIRDTLNRGADLDLVKFLSDADWRDSLLEENVEFEAEWPTFSYGL